MRHTGQVRIGLFSERLCLVGIFDRLSPPLEQLGQIGSEIASTLLKRERTFGLHPVKKLRQSFVHIGRQRFLPVFLPGVPRVFRMRTPTNAGGSGHHTIDKPFGDIRRENVVVL
ncbi:MAG: hypothetical protein KDM64_11750, partial [Verrucomicrobiae bacterium]|nr:hypothetical protein [Verrucomicrobiae bacterium]